jgi:hypothetical protein
MVKLLNTFPTNKFNLFCFWIPGQKPFSKLLSNFTCLVPPLFKLIFMKILRRPDSGQSVLKSVNKDGREKAHCQ